MFDTLRIAPEHVSKNVLRLMNKDKGDLTKFIREFNKNRIRKGLSFYFMAAHPGSTMKEAARLADAISKLENAESVQVFTPTPGTLSTAMYYTGENPMTKEKVHVPRKFREKKDISEGARSK